MKYLVFSCIAFLLTLTAVKAEEGLKSPETTVDVQILVVDGTTEEPIPAAKIIIKGQPSEMFTDLDGMAKVEKLDAGEYDIEISFISYEKKSFKALKLDNSSSQLFVKLYP